MAMPAAEPHPAVLDPETLLAQCHEHRGRVAGPGGQHRNKVETAVGLVHGPTGIRGFASERRSLVENRRMALFRLRVNLALEVRYPADPFAGPSPLWRSRCVPKGPPSLERPNPRAGKIIVNPGHRDFPALLAEALDVLATVNWDVSAAVMFLGCSMSQLVKFLADEPRALALLNQQRAHKGLKPLRGGN